jgi:hypothetical protein
VLALLLAGFAWHCATHAVDFPIYHRVGQQILAGNVELYPAEVYDGRVAPGHGFRYAPAIAFLFVPFALLPLVPAALVFFAIKLAAFIAMMRVIARRMAIPSRSVTLMLASLLFAGGYLIEEARNGNIHLIIVALIVIALDLAERRRVVVPAAALALGIATKVTPLLVLPYWIFRRRYGAALATLGCLALLWIAPAAIVGMRENNHLTEGFLRYTVEKVDEADNYSVRGVLTRYLERKPPDPRYPDPAVVDLSASLVTAIWIGLLAAGGVILLVAVLRRSDHPATMPVEWALLLLTMLLASPHSQRPYFSVVCVPAAVLLALALKREPVVAPTALRASLVLSALVSTLLPLVLSSRRVALAYESTSPYFIGALALTGVLVHLRMRGIVGRRRGDATGG